ncbi:MAG: hypothetical protein ABSF45_19365 [Terriglobia bacterium]
MAVKLRRIRLESDRALIRIHRSLEVPKPFLRCAEILMGLRGLRAKLCGTPEAINRLLNPAFGQV